MRPPPAGPLAYLAIRFRSRYQLVGPLDQALDCPLGQGQRGEAGWHAQAFLGSAVGDVDPPLVDGDLDPAERGHGIDQEQCVTLLPTDGLDVVAHAGGRLGVDQCDDGRRGVCRHEEPRIERLAPLGLHLTTSAPSRSATSHIRSPKTPLTPTTTTSPGRTTFTKEASMPAEPVPLIGSVRALSVPNTLAEALAGLIEHDQEVRVQVAQQGPGQRHGHGGVRIGRPGAHEQAVWIPHRRIVTGLPSPAPTRRSTRWASDRLPAWNGCSSPRRSHPNCPQTFPRMSPAMPPGRPLVRRSVGHALLTRRTSQDSLSSRSWRPLRTDSTERCRASRRQTSRTWSLTILVAGAWAGQVERVVASSPRAIRRRIRIVNARGPG